MDLPQAWCDRDSPDIIVSQLDADRRSRSRCAESLGCGCVLATGTPGREPPAADISANAGLAEVVLRSGLLAVDVDVDAVHGFVIGHGAPLCFLDKFFVALCVVQRHVERFGCRAIFRCGLFVFVVAPLEQR